MGNGQWPMVNARWLDPASLFALIFSLRSLLFLCVSASKFFDSTEDRP